MRPRTVLEVAASTGYRPDVVRSLLEEEQKRGHVERVGAGWRLTASAKQRYGSALRDMGPLVERRR